MTNDKLSMGDLQIRSSLQSVIFHLSSVICHLLKEEPCR